jgi:hypothetical protein
MQISNDRYFYDRRRHDLALRMIRHEARTCTIRSCTGLTDDRIRQLYKTYASHLSNVPVRRRRGKSPRQVAFFIRSTRAQLESSLLASLFTVFGLLDRRPAMQDEPIEFGRLFCDAYETHRQLLRTTHISFEHAWFLLQLLKCRGDLQAVRCRRCDSPYLRDRLGAGCRRSCPVCKLKKSRADTRSRRCAARQRHEDESD